MKVKVSLPFRTIGIGKLCYEYHTPISHVKPLDPNWVKIHKGILVIPWMVNA